jgi:hypothetical protein
MDRTAQLELVTPTAPVLPGRLPAMTICFHLSEIAVMARTIKKD